ncbi:MAG: hypothetical protein JO070_09630, partial [Verrucomicrobia bacterium]|nr:hypothetical protein [Verrucomicrobiota bacterium]
MTYMTYVTYVTYEFLKDCHSFLRRAPLLGQRLQCAEAKTLSGYIPWISPERLIGRGQRK